MKESTNYKSQENLNLNSNKMVKLIWRVSTQTMAQIINRSIRTMVSKLRKKWHKMTKLIKRKN